MSETLVVQVTPEEFSLLQAIRDDADAVGRTAEILGPVRAAAVDAEFRRGRTARIEVVHPSPSGEDA